MIIQATRVPARPASGNVPRGGSPFPADGTAGMILSVVQCDTDNGACQYDVRLTDLEAPKDQQADTSY